MSGFKPTLNVNPHTWRRVFSFENLLPQKPHPIPLAKKLFEVFGKMNSRNPLKMPPKGCRTPKTNIAPNERPHEPFVFACPPTERCKSRIASAEGASEENFDDFRQKTAKKQHPKNSAFAVHRSCCNWLTCPPVLFFVRFW